MNNNSFFLSIITVNYNNKRGLEKTLQSAMEQDSQDFEHIVIDGGSNDGSKEILERYSNNLSIWISEKDDGIYDAMNKGIKIAKGKYLYFLNSGDELYNSSVISSLIDDFSSDVDVLYGNIVRGNKGSESNILQSYPVKLRFSYFLSGQTLPHQGAFIRKDTFLRIGLYNTDYTICADRLHFILAICKYEMSYKYINKTVAYYDTSGISSQERNRLKADEEFNSIMKNYFSTFIQDYHDAAEQSKTMLHLKQSRLIRWLQSFGILSFIKHDK